MTVQKFKKKQMLNFLRNLDKAINVTQLTQHTTYDELKNKSISPYRNTR